MLLMALYSYKSSHSRTLAFTAGDKFIEIGPSLDPNWQHVVNECGNVGYVPKNYIGLFQGSANACLDFIDGCIEGIHLRSCETGGSGPRVLQTLQRLVQLRQTVSSGTKRPAPLPPAKLQYSSSCKALSGDEICTSFSAAHEPAIESHSSSATSQCASFPTSPVPSPVTASNSPSASIAPCTIEEKAMKASPVLSSRRSDADNINQNEHVETSPPFLETSSFVDIKEHCVRIPDDTLRKLVADVRQTANISFACSQEVVKVVLDSLSSAIPLLKPVTKAILEESCELPSEVLTDRGRWWAASPDATLAVQLFEKLRQCKDDEQQRSWALHEDLPVITRHLQQLLDVITNGESRAVKAVLQLEDYRPLLTLVQYYQMETRPFLRTLLLQIFSSCCNLSPLNGLFLTNTVLPVELAREMLSSDTSVEVLETVMPVMTLLLAVADAFPYTHYSIMNRSFCQHLLDGVEKHSSLVDTENLADLYMLSLLAYNLHDWPRNASTEATSNDTASILPSGAASKSTATGSFDVTESLVLKLLDDPLLCMFDTNAKDRPHSVLQMLEDLYSYRPTAGLFYTNDERVLCDIILRLLANLSSHDERRVSCTRLSSLVLLHGRWSDHQHRLAELQQCYSLIVREHSEAASCDVSLDTDVAAAIAAAANVVRRTVEQRPDLLSDVVVP